MDYAVVFNTLSGRRSKKINNALYHKLQKELGHSIHVYEANTLELLVVHINEILRSDAHSLIIAGGDGTLNRVINSLLRSECYRDINLAVLPNGTGNSFCLDLGIVDITSAIDTIKLNRLTDVRIGLIENETENRYFINNFGIGFVYNIAALASKMRFLGQFSYIIATLVQLIRLKPISFQYSVNGVTHNESVIFADICKSQYTGGDMLMAPSADIRKGEFQLILLKSVTRLQLLAAFPKLFRGEHLKYDFVDSMFGESIRLECQPNCHSLIDGDLAFTCPVDITIAPQKLTFYTSK
jgi:YegS/Rv2252/BmrU family lipid kinase